MKYESSHMQPEHAQALGEFMEAHGGEVVAEEVLEFARPKRSPIHGYFEWDEAKAAHEHRLDQARFYIRKLVIQIRRNKQPIKVRAFHCVPAKAREEGAEANVYASVKRISRNPTYAEAVVAKAQAELIGWRNRYVTYQEVFGVVFEAIDEIENGALEPVAG